jgi:hypothetical protein
MPDSRDESPDIEDNQVLDGSETLEGDPGDDPLDEDIVTPERWSAVLRLELAETEQQSDATLDELLAEEEPDLSFDTDDEVDENAPEEDVRRHLTDLGPDPRAGRLVAEDEEAHDSAEASLITSDDLVARDEGIDGGAATAEEAAMHVIDDTRY